MTVKSILFGFIALWSASCFASASISIDNDNFTPERVITGMWGGEPVVGDVKGYGIAEMYTVTAFFDERALRDVVSSVLHFNTDEDIHAVHLHGTGTSSGIAELHGYTLIIGDEQTQVFRMETYTRTPNGYVLDDSFSGGARGALDCGSAAKLAILHGPALEPLVTMTLGKTEYEHTPESEEKFASYLTNATALLARDRARLEWAVPY